MSIIQKTIITILILAGWNATIFFFVILPAVNDIKAFNDRIQLERMAVENKYTSRRNIKNIIADLKYVVDGLAPLEKEMIIQKDSEVEFVNGLEKIADKNNLAQKIRIAPAAQGQSEKMAARQNISIALSGGYIDTLRYLDDLEKSKIYIIITNVNISSASENIGGKTVNSAGTIRTNLEGYVYFSI